MSKPDDRVARYPDDEESPSSAGQGCLITSGEGDFRESATEIYRRASGKGEKARQELTGVLVTGRVHVNPTRSKTKNWHKKRLPVAAWYGRLLERIGDDTARKMIV